MASRQAKFKLKSRGVGQLLNSDMVAGEMLRRARVVKSVAESISPVGPESDPHRGAYKASWYAHVERKAVGRTQRKRPVGVVGNTSYYARWVEYGGQRVQGQHVLLRAARAGGG